MSDLDLARLRATVGALLGEHRALPLSELTAVSSLCTGGARLTLDIEASQQVGFPIVLVEQRPSVAPSFLARLSAREREVAQLIAAGLCSKEIASTLGISLGTVKDHVHAVLSKSGLSSRLEVASTMLGR